MKKLEILEANALTAYNSADEKGKNLLADLFGKAVFNQKITDRVKSFEDALAIVGAVPNVQILLDYNGQDRDMISAQAFAKLTIIARALNEGWTPDWSNSNEYKYYPWMEYSVGSGFSFGAYDFGHPSADVGSRLCFKSRELAEYAGKQFKDIYNDFLSL